MLLWRYRIPRPRLLCFQPFLLMEPRLDNVEQHIYMGTPMYQKASMSKKIFASTAKLFKAACAAYIGKFFIPPECLKYQRADLLNISIKILKRCGNRDIMNLNNSFCAQTSNSYCEKTHLNRG